MTVSEKVIATTLLVVAFIAACISFHSGIKILHAQERLNQCDGVEIAPSHIKCSSDPSLLDDVWKMRVGDMVEVELCEY